MAEMKTGAWLHNGDGVNSTSYEHLPEGHMSEVTYDRILPYSIRHAKSGLPRSWSETSTGRRISDSESVATSND